MVQCAETQKYSNCSILDIFEIHQQMLTDGTCGHNTSFTEMFPFVFPVFETGSVLLRQLVLLFSVFHMWIPWGAYVFHISSLWGLWWTSCCVIYYSSMPNTLSWEAFMQTRRCPQLSVTFSVDRTSYASCSCLNFPRVCYRVSEMSGFYMWQPTCCEHSLYCGKKPEISRLSVGETRYEKRSSILDCIQFHCTK